MGISSLQVKKNQFTESLFVCGFPSIFSLKQSACAVPYFRGISPFSTHKWLLLWLSSLLQIFICKSLGTLWGKAHVLAWWRKERRKRWDKYGTSVKNREIPVACDLRDTRTARHHVACDGGTDGWLCQGCCYGNTFAYMYTSHYKKISSLLYGKYTS